MAILLPLVLLFIFKASGTVAIYAVMLIIILAMSEWFKFCGELQDKTKLLFIPAFLALIFIASRTAAMMSIVPLIAFYLVFGSLFIHLARQNKPSLAWGKHGLLLLGAAYLALSYYAFCFIVEFAQADGHWRYWILALLLMIWSADSFAYFAGKRWGKTKLAANISPGKTFEGAAGGLLGTLFVAVISYYTIIKYVLCQQECAFSLWVWLVLATVIFVLSIIGDLFESIFKRMANLKDSGGIIPGHGGILDRLDSLFMSLPCYAMFLKLIH